MITLPARPESLTFAPQQSALIVVDMQNAYASQGGYLDLAGFDVSATRPVIDNINTAVAAAFDGHRRNKRLDDDQESQQDHQSIRSAEQR